MSYSILLCFKIFILKGVIDFMKKMQKFAAHISCLHSYVTGSCISIRVTYPNEKDEFFTVDCGLFQDTEEDKNVYFPFCPKDYKFSVNTHVHEDHIGRYPLFIKDGFRGNIYTSVPSFILTPMILYHNSYLYNKKEIATGVEALYTSRDVDNSLKHFLAVPYRKILKPTKHISVILYENGHIIGACVVLVIISYPGKKDIKLLFSGDYNDHNMFFKVPTLPTEILNSYVSCAIVESTYGSITSTDKKLQPKLISFLREELLKGTTVYLPAFSLGRTQELCYLIKVAMEQNEIPTVPVWLDGKSSQKITDLFLYENLGIDISMRNFLPKTLQFVKDSSVRFSIMSTKTPQIVIAPGGFSDYGAITKYLPDVIEDNNSAIFYTSYVSPTSTGGILQTLAKGDTFLYRGTPFVKKCVVDSSGEISAHIKGGRFIEKLKEIKTTYSFLTNHGEEKSQEIFANQLSETFPSSIVDTLQPDTVFIVESDGIVDILS